MLIIYVLIFRKYVPNIFEKFDISI
jgi:hypothetical protein